MGLVGSLRSKGVQLAGQAMTKLFEDEKRAAQIGELIGKIQQGRKRLDAAQESALQSLGLVSSGELKDASKRLAALRKSARKLDEKLGTLANKVDARG